MTAPDSAEPEKVLVFEIVGSVNTFVKAVRKAGLEWLMDLRADGIEPDDGFYEVDYRDGTRKAKTTLDGRLFLTMTDQQALVQMMSLWNLWKDDKPLPRGFTPWRDVFAQLTTVRYWEAKDRLADTGLAEDWTLRVSGGQQSVPLEVELWYRENHSRREEAQRRISDLIKDAGGEVVASAMIDDIRYHAVAGRLSASDVQSFLNQTDQDAELVRCDDVMFFRPTGQVATVSPASDEVEDFEVGTRDSIPSGPPVAALLDGMPVQRHPLLARHVLMDDPDDWAGEYPVRARKHGTAMASLIVHGDLSGDSVPIPMPLLARPIMLPGPPDFYGNTVEHIPDMVLPADLIRRAVVRIFEGEAGEDAVAPTVRVVNLSVGDSARPFGHAMSPWARCLDWLSHRYGVLFVVSAGNNGENLELGLPKDGLSEAHEEDRCDAFILAGVQDHADRRLISPSESLNSLTVGALHADLAGDVQLPSGFCEPYARGTLLPSPVSRSGLGYRRTVKPDVVNPGGRAVYSEHPVHNGTNAVARLRQLTRAPGQKVAAPPPSAAVPAATVYTIGTSNAAALTTRAAVTLFKDVVQPILGSPGRLPMNRRHQSAMLKTLLVHGARWPEDESRIASVLAQAGLDGRQTRDWRTRLYGYGLPDPARVTFCTDQRATLLGWSDIDPQEAHVYRVPIPPSLSGRREGIRLTTTVGWFTPINPRHQEYRRAALAIEFPEMTPREAFGATGSDVHHDASGRGTLLHRVLEGRRATAFGDDEFLEIRLNCRAAAGDLDDSVPYSIAVTLEVAEESDVPIYDEVRARVGVPVNVTA
jgi:Subtilase family.